MVFPSPGIGRHHIPMHHFEHSHFGSYGGYNYGGRSLFSGLTSSFNNFTNNFMTYSWASLGINAGLSLISMFLPFGWRSGISGGAYSYSGAGGTGGTYTSTTTTTIRTTDVIVKDLKNVAVLSEYGNTAAVAKANANDFKKAKNNTLERAKKVKITKDGQNSVYTCKAIKDIFKNTRDSRIETMINSALSGKDDSDSVTAADLKLIVDKLTTLPDSGYTKDKILGLLSGNAEKALEDLKTCQEQYNTAAEAATAAAKLKDSDVMSDKTEALKKEYAASESGISENEYNQLKARKDAIDKEMTDLGLAKKGNTRRYRVLTRQLDKIDTGKITRYEAALAEADTKINAAKSEAVADGPSIPEESAEPEASSTK